MTDQTHAQILSDIAKKVVGQHRQPRGFDADVAEYDRRVKADLARRQAIITEYWPDDAPAHHESWDYVLPEKYQG
jgi:hypothetical protein